MHLDPSNSFRLALDGTSGSVLLTDAAGEPVSPPLMYNDGRATQEAALVASLAPSTTAAHGPFSGLAKILWLKTHQSNSATRLALNQADWIVGRLTDKYGVSDSNNALKMGYDAVTKSWPQWIKKLPIPDSWWPRVGQSGTLVGTITEKAALATHLPAHTQVVLGTTDSTAAVWAAGVGMPGDAVTSLGSTLVMKVICEHPIFAPHYGVYSQPFGKYWLVGGGSNSGGAVLRDFFTDEEMKSLTALVNVDKPTELNYYPLQRPGERFPVCDPDLEPKLTPRPKDDAIFFQGILEGMATIEKRAYDVLAEMNAPYPTQVATVGGGAKNDAWTQLRAQRLGIPVYRPQHEDACYGSALIAGLTHNVNRPM